MNWIIQADFNEYESLSNKESLTDYEQYRLQELQSNIDYYNRTYIKGGD